MKKLLAEWRNYLEEAQGPTKKLRVLIIGDSQTGTIGYHLENKLKGEYSVERHVHRGFPINKIYTKLQKIKGRYGVVVIFAGGNGGADPASVNSMLDSAEKLSTNVIWVGPPPATKITNIGYANRVFPGNNIKSDDHWLRSGTSKRREDNNKTIKNAIAGKATYVDVRDFATPFPPQTDGIHVRAPASAAIAGRLATIINS